MVSLLICALRSNFMVTTEQLSNSLLQYSNKKELLNHFLISSKKKTNITYYNQSKSLTITKSFFMSWVTICQLVHYTIWNIVVFSSQIPKSKLSSNHDVFTWSNEMYKSTQYPTKRVHVLLPQNDTNDNKCGWMYD